MQKDLMFPDVPGRVCIPLMLRLTDLVNDFSIISKGPVAQLG